MIQEEKVLQQKTAQASQPVQQSPLIEEDSSGINILEWCFIEVNT